MSATLPRELQYSDTLPSLPTGVQSLDQTLMPVNGSVFSCATSGTLVQWDLPARGYLVPDSMYIKYKWTITPVAGQISKMRGTPVYTPISRLETIFGSQPQENISNYNQIQNMITNCTLNVAQKFGLQSCYGYKTSGTSAHTLQSLDGRIIDATELTGNFAAPLPCLLSNSEKLVPLGFMPSVRIQLTLESIANMFAPATGAASAASEFLFGTQAENVSGIPTGFDISDFQLCYTMLDMGPEVDSAVRSMGETLVIKSQSFVNSGATVGQGTSGLIELPFSQRLASIKSIFLHCSTPGVNGMFDSFDITGAGDYQLNIAGRMYPPRPVNAAGTKVGALMELKKACGSLFDKQNNFSIDTIEFSRVLGNVSTLASPAKFYLGVNTELIPSNYVLLSGVSSQATAVSARINITAATAAIATVNLIACFDAIIEVRPAEKAAVVRQ